MKKHTKIYMDFFGYDISDFIPCEICGANAVDVHHIDARGMGGDPTGEKDHIGNLQALCREDHEQYGDVPGYEPFLTRIHLQFMKENGPKDYEFYTNPKKQLNENKI